MIDAASHQESNDALSMSERIYRQLKSELIVGAYLPGDKISMRKLADRLGTSVMPVREALKRLAAERALESAQQRSFRVPKLAGKRTADLFSLRALLEGEAVEQATGALSENDFVDLALHDRTMERHIGQRNFAGYLEANFLFHFTIYRASRNEDLVELIEQLWARTGPSLHQGLIDSAKAYESKKGPKTPITEPYAKTWRNFHEALLRALRNGNAVMARDMIRHDIDWGVRLFGARVSRLSTS